MARAPLYEDVADAPEGGEAAWLTAADGVRIRAAHWPNAIGTRPLGTVLLFTGRTEYVEKYGPAARYFTALGYSFATLDWRGQGLSDHAFADRRLGHVDDFAEYQRDIAALLAWAQQRGLPRPFFLVAHSMGGCIGLRALHLGLDVAAVAFSGPMWGIKMAPWAKPVAWLTSHAAVVPAVARVLAPGTSRAHTVEVNPFEGNDLTTDRMMWDFLRLQIAQHPDLALGGPTLGWLRAALAETRALTALAPPAVAALTCLGSHDRIVEAAPIRRLMEHWPGGRLDIMEGAEHEIMMERTEVRSHFYESAAELFRLNGAQRSAG